MAEPALDGRRPHRVPDAFVPFVDAGILDAADVHVATTLCRLHAEVDDLVLLGVAFAARAPRAGHTCLDVDQVAAAVADELPGGAAAGPSDDEQVSEDPVADLPWPDPSTWVTALAASTLVGDDDRVGALVIEGRQVFLTRQWELEVALAEDLRRRATQVDPQLDPARLGALLDRLFVDAEPDDAQRRAVEVAAARRLAVLAGGPGTGKTWTAARILAACVDQAMARGEDLQVAIVAPTGKAAARLDEGLREALADMDVPDDLRDRLGGLGRGQTIHRLLGRRSATRFWHDRDRPLPHDLVVVDETSMASLSLTARLLEAIRPDARVVLVGDPGQLASVEAGSVLADIVGDGGDRDGVVVLQRPRRFGGDSGIGRFARLVRDGDADGAVEVLQQADDLAWVTTSDPTPDDLAAVRRAVVDRADRLVRAARAGDVDGAVGELGAMAVLCAHRRGRDGVAGWNARVDRWLADEVDGWSPYQDWQAGRVVLATSNDRRLQVFNGDLGVVVAHTTSDGRDVLRAVFPGAPKPVAPARLEQAQQVHAMTIHKSQGSQWDHVVVVLPGPGSRILTRELLYTAATRAARRLTVVGDPGVLRTAIDRPVRRASGLARRIAG